MTNPLVERCAGIDIGKKELAVTLMTGPGDRAPEMETRTFRTTNRALRDLREWLVAAGCEQIVMESTGSYWKPVFYVLEGAVQCHLANPMHVKNVRGHKTDVADSIWLAQLLRHGMIRSSFIPPEDIRQLRDLTRRRKRLIGVGASEKNRIAKVLEDANVKLSSVLSSLFGVTGQAILARMLAGEFVAKDLAHLAKARARLKIAEIEEALDGHRFNDHHRMLIRQSLEHLAFLDRQIQQLDGEILRSLEPYRESYDLLQTIPGIKAEGAAVLLAELGPDMSVFPTDGQAASWAGLCPGNNRTASVQKNGRTTGGNRWLKATLTESSWSASRAKNTIFERSYRRWQRTLGKKKAAVAVCHLLLRTAYHVLKDRTPFIPLGPDADDRHRQKRIRHHCKRLRELGVSPSILEKALEDLGLPRTSPVPKGPRRIGSLGVRAY